MSNEQKAIFDKATHTALNHLASASDALMGVDMARYPHIREAAQVVDTAVGIIDDGRNVAAVEAPFTVFIFDDQRDWNDPLITFVDAVGCETAEDLRGVIIEHYGEMFNTDDCVTNAQYWIDAGGVIQAILPGAVQVGWQVGGVDNHTIDAARNNFKAGM